jgi:hypothetical protein
MRKILCTLFIGSLLCTAWTGSASAAGNLLNSPLVCTTDGVNFGGAGDPWGLVQLTRTGQLHVALKNLTPDEQATCVLECTQGGNFSGAPTPCGTANSSGKINFSLHNFIDPAALCRGPLVTVTLSGGGECDQGWGAGS